MSTRLRHTSGTRVFSATSPARQSTRASASRSCANTCWPRSRAADVSPGLIGARVRRADDPRLLTGHGAYVDDIALPGMLHMAVWRSPIAHGLVRVVNTAR